MDFVSVLLILILYFIRPQDWVPGMAGVNIIQPIALLAILATLARRGLPSMKSLLSTPLDFLMLAYGLYITVTAPDSVDAFFGVLPLMAFYFMTRLALDTPERLQKYLLVWVAMLVTIAAFGAGSLIGIDITGAKEMTEKFGGRLALGTWIHNNPNSLGHSVIVALPLLYIALFWRSVMLRRLIAVALAALVAYCAFHTSSRGSYIAGLVVVGFGFTLGRPKIVQALIAILLISSATAILSTLPRMAKLSSLRADEGVQGRIMAWEIARTAAEQKTYGDGWKEFTAYITFEGDVIAKATHSCFVRVSADLGLPGLFLYLAILWCGARSLLSLRTVGINNLEAERSRRMLFAILIGYLVSGWMIDRSYHTEFFLMAAAISAMYKLYRLEPVPEGDAVTDELTEAGLTPSMSIGFSPTTMQPKAVFQEQDESVEPRSVWRRFGILDIVVCLALVHATLALWDYVMDIM